MKKSNKISPRYIILIGIACLLPRSVTAIGLLDSIIEFKEDLFAGIFGKGKCGCPCRSFDVPTCEVQYVQQCSYEHYQQVCNTVPVPSVAYVKQTECQKCQKYNVQVPVTKLAIECNPVYDEKCTTSYPKHCKVETRCHELYQTVCQTSYNGYGQSCGSQPVQQCYPETKCHRTPMTSCRPVQKDKCVKVPREALENRVEKTCLPFERSQAEIDAMVHVNPCNGAAGLDALQHQAGGPVLEPHLHHQVHTSTPAVHDSHHHHVSHEQPIQNGYSVAAPPPPPAPVHPDSYGGPIVQRDTVAQQQFGPVLRQQEGHPGPHFNPYAKRKNANLRIKKSDTTAKLNSSRRVPKSTSATTNKRSDRLAKWRSNQGPSSSAKSTEHEKVNEAAMGRLVSSDGWIPISGTNP